MTFDPEVQSIIVNIREKDTVEFSKLLKNFEKKHGQYDLKDESNIKWDKVIKHLLSIYHSSNEDFTRIICLRFLKRLMLSPHALGKNYIEIFSIYLSTLTSANGNERNAAYFILDYSKFAIALYFSEREESLIAKEIRFAWLNLFFALIRSEKEFILAKHLKNYSVFMKLKDDGTKLYAVIGLKSGIEEIIYDQLPVIVDAVLLPFEGKIVFDGFLNSYNDYFGSGIRKEWNEAYNESKIRNGIITSLPYLNPGLQSKENLLKSYLRNKKTVEIYSKEIGNLITNNAALNQLYYQEVGKIYSKSISKNLKDAGVGSVYVAILKDIIISTNHTKEELNKTIKAILPKDKHNLVYIFRIR